MRKRRSHKYSNLDRAGIELGTLWSEAEILPTVPTMPAEVKLEMSRIFLHPNSLKLYKPLKK